MPLSNNITQLRKAMGLSQEQLAEQIGVSRQSVSKWETGQSVPELDKLVLLSQIFRVSTDEMLGNSSFDKETHQPSSSMEHYIRLNFLRRVFTIGWITSLAGFFALLAELISLFFIRNSTVEVNASHGIGFYLDPWRYAQEPPMNHVLLLTLLIIFVGLLVSGFSFWSMRHKR